MSLCVSSQRVNVSRTFQSSNNQCLDTTNPDPSAQYWPAGQSVLWMGCSPSGTSRVPLYSWKKTGSGSVVTDRIYSLSNSNPFAPGALRSGYKVESLGNACCYVYTTQIDPTLVPLYQLEAQDPNGNVYHTTNVGSGTLNVNGLVYNQMTGLNNNGFYGYVLPGSQ